MDATTLKMAMAGLFHDIGKIADRDTMGIGEKYFDDNANIYLPFRDGNFSHYHALYTAAFVEQMSESLPPELNSGTWGEGDSFINLAACHHKPETPMQQVITVADWLSSGMDRDEFEGEFARGIAFQDYKKTRLLPLFEQLRLPEKDTAEKFGYAYPLAPLSPEAIFPLMKEYVGKEEAKEQYRKLYDGFTKELPGLLHKSENLALWSEHFESLMMVYMSSVPAARAGKVVHDVSLYDHSRLTSAFASAIFLYHREKETLN
ncbi:MAG: type III-A CRISPR-associated protein Cas10/Csm1, partial [Deltaproteobacteria bacterium]